MTCSPAGSGPLTRFADVLAYLDGLGLFHMDMGLGRMEGALRALKVSRLPCPVVQVVGTNGKGSTASFLQSLSMAHGFRAGLFTSPHFLSPAERIRMNRRNLPEAAWPGLAQRAVAAEAGLTYFELLTVMAVLAFQDAEPDLLIFEAGLGGRHDATTALPADLVCFTPIDLDHQAVLGPDIATIAADKADAMRPGIFAAVSAPQPDEALAALRQRALGLGLPLYSADSGADLPPLALLPDDAELGLAGPHQRVNAQTALLAWSLLCRRQGWRTDEKSIRRGLADAFIPGRLHKVPARGGYPPFLLDGAHNPHGMNALARALPTLPAPDKTPCAVIFSCLADKRPEDMARLVRGLAPGRPLLIPTIGHNERAMPGEELASLIGPDARPVANLKTAVELLRPLETENAPILVCGSLYLLTEFFNLFPDTLSGPRA
ncbi:MAG: bifunctional folylpolyglutamate synthase/dihydrofolate synthase [Desulfovibrionaceae bacterium]|nr:bifunctional folylpolyglutamate synthase/dihydrofolate synthase [Desulfovibrionaceae bacterium]